MPQPHFVGVVSLLEAERSISHTVMHLWSLLQGGRYVIFTDIIRGEPAHLFCVFE